MPMEEPNGAPSQGVVIPPPAKNGVAAGDEASTKEEEASLGGVVCLLLSLKEEQQWLADTFGEFRQTLQEVHDKIVGVESGRVSSKTPALLPFPHQQQQQQQLLRQQQQMWLQQLQQPLLQQQQKPLLQNQHAQQHLPPQQKQLQPQALESSWQETMIEIDAMSDQRSTDQPATLTSEVGSVQSTRPVDGVQPRSNSRPEPRPSLTKKSASTSDIKGEASWLVPSASASGAAQPLSFGLPMLAPPSPVVPVGGRRLSIHSMADAGIATSEVAAMIEGAEGALQSITYDDGTHRNPESQLDDSVHVNTLPTSPRWKKGDIRSGRHSSRTLLRELCTSHSDKPFTQRMTYGILCGIVIVIDSVVIAFETDDRAKTGDIGSGYEVMGYLFPAWYVSELVLRILFTKPWHAFFTGKDSGWNSFDFVLISCSIVELILQEVDSAQVRFVAVGRILRLLRLFRVIRVLRIIRFMTFMREFHKLVLCLASSCQTLLCVLSMMAFVIFCFSVMFVQLVTGHLDVHEGYVPASQEEEELLTAFGTVGRAMISLYMSITAGRNWGELADLLLWIDPGVRAIFFVYLSLSIFGLMNVVTAVFVESAMQATQNYRDLLVQEMTLKVREIAMKERANVKHMKEIFKCIDTDNSGAISYEEMTEYMADDRLNLQEYFEALQLSASDTYTLFQLLDVDRSGQVDIDEFCDGCIRLGGNAKSFDMNCMWYEQRRTNRELLRFIQHACMCLHTLGKNTQTQEQTQELIDALEDTTRRLLAQAARPMPGLRRSSTSLATVTSHRTLLSPEQSQAQQFPSPRRSSGGSQYQCTETGDLLMHPAKSGGSDGHGPDPAASASDSRADQLRGSSGFFSASSPGMSLSSSSTVMQRNAAMRSQHAPGHSTGLTSTDGDSTLGPNLAHHAANGTADEEAQSTTYAGQVGPPADPRQVSITVIGGVPPAVPEEEAIQHPAPPSPAGAGVWKWL